MLTINQLDIYNDLLALTQANEAFYIVDQKMDDIEYRIFNYRLASYTDFCAKNALEARGIMFELKDGQPIRLVARTPEKFFNYRENPFTMTVDFTQTTDIMDKADGSLISTYSHKDTVKLKTKASLFSEQAQAAQQLLDNNDELLYALSYMVDRNFTVNMEYVSPTNRIVLPYDKAKLIVLGIRHNDTGEYVTLNNLRDVVRADINNILFRYWIKTIPVNDIVSQYNSVEQFVESMDKQENIEGYVLRVNKQFMKLKTNWYLVRHRAKDSINSTRRLFEAVLDEAIDDVRALFYDDLAAITRINEIQIKADHIYNHLVSSIETFYSANKELDRKSYAILGQETFKDGTFGLAMSKYLGKGVEYKEFLKKNYKKYGFTDNVINTDE